MGTVHTVQQGEYLSRIATNYGFSSHRIIWDDPQNAALREKRQNPSVLFPGDSLFIPDKEQRIETRSTGSKHTFEMLDEPLKLRLVLLNESAEPVPAADYTLDVDGDVEQKKTTGSGHLHKDIESDAQTARLRVRPTDQSAELDLDIDIGHLDPENEVTGQIARLNNLGYDAGDVQLPADADARMKFRSAVEEFQCNTGLKVDGICGPNTQAKLKQTHGC